MDDSQWRQIKEELLGKLSKGQYDLWVSTLELLGVEDTRLVLGCRNRLHRDWLKEKLEKEIVRIARGRFPQVRKVEYRILDDAGAPAAPSEDASAPKPPQPRQIAIQDIIGHAAPVFNPRFTFDQFVVGNCNQFAYSAAMAMAASRQVCHQSVYLLSETGLGKSHLAQALGNHLRVQKPQMRVRYVTAEQFANELVGALKGGFVENFKKKYREKCDLLLMERMEFLSGKEKIQSELLYTMDELLDRGKRIVCTGKTLPRDIPKLNEDLQSRLTGVLLAPIERPDFGMRLEIVQKKARNENILLPENVVELLADRITGDVRQLESCLVGLITKSNLLNVPVTLDMAREATEAMTARLPRLTVEHIQQVVCHTFNVELKEMRSKRRQKDLALARQMAMYLCRHYTSDSLEAIGRAFSRSHSTVVYAVNTLTKKMEGKDNKLKRQVDYVSQRLETGCICS